MGEILSDALNWFLEKLIDLVVYPFKLLVDLIAVILNAIPVPGFISNLPSYISSVPTDVWFWASLFEIPFGFSVCIAAALAKFVIRRLPVVG